VDYRDIVYDPFYFLKKGKVWGMSGKKCSLSTCHAECGHDNYIKCLENEMKVIERREM
jgi:hypothetical protein